MLHLQIGKLNIRVRFAVVDNLAVDIFLETLFVDKYIREDSSPKRKLVPWSSQAVAIMVPTAKTTNVPNVADHIDF